MPKVMRTGGLNLTDDVVKIRDVGPQVPPPRHKAKGRPAPPADGVDDISLSELEEDEITGEPTEADFIADDLQSEPMEPAVSGVGGISGSAIKEEIIQSAMSEAGRILEDAVRSAEQQKSDILAGIEAEAEQIRQGAFEEGEKQGFTAVVNEVQDAANNLQSAIAQFEGGRAGFEAEYEEQLKWMAMEIASKVLAKKVSDDDAVMVDMVDKAVQSVKSEAWVRVEVAQEMHRLLDRLTELYDAQSHIDVSAVPAQPGTVQIETPSGVIDASLRTQLANLKDYFAQSQ